MGEQQCGGGQRDQSRSPRPARLGRGGCRGQQGYAYPRQLQWLGLRQRVEALDRRPAQREQDRRHRGLQRCPAPPPYESSEHREQTGQEQNVDGEEGERPNADEAENGGVDEPVGREKPAGLWDEVKRARPPADHLAARLQRQTVVQEPELRGGEPGEHD